MRCVALALALSACTSLSAAPDSKVRAVQGLREDARVAQLVTPIAFGDGDRWLGGIDHDLVTFEGEREVARWSLASADALTALSGGRWAAGARVLDSAGAVLFDGYSWSQRYGRFGSPSAYAFSPDGATAIIAARDSPSMCLCDRERGTGGSSKGAVVRLSFGRERDESPVERELMKFDGTRFAVAASPRAVAAIEPTSLKVWAAKGDDPPLVVPFETRFDYQRLVWVGDRYLVAERVDDVEHAELIVFDRDQQFAITGRIRVSGMIQGLAVRPGATDEIAVVTSRYRARTVVEVDEKLLQVIGLDGKVHALATLDAYPIAVAWDRAGTRLLVALSTPASAVVRFAVR